MRESLLVFEQILNDSFCRINVHAMPLGTPYSPYAAAASVHDDLTDNDSSSSVSSSFSFMSNQNDHEKSQSGFKENQSRRHSRRKSRRPNIGRDSEIIVILNKYDLFCARFNEFPKYFPEYTGPVTSEAILDYIKGMYLEIAHRLLGKDKPIYIITTILTEPRAIDARSPLIVSRAIEESDFGNQLCGDFLK